MNIVPMLGSWLYLVSGIVALLILFCVIILLSMKENPDFKKEKVSICTQCHVIPPSGDLLLPVTKWMVFGTYFKHRYEVFGLKFWKSEFVMIMLRAGNYEYVGNVISKDDAIDLANQLNTAVESLQTSLNANRHGSYPARNVLHTSNYKLEVSCGGGGVRSFSFSDFRWDVRAETSAIESDSIKKKEEGHILLRLHDISKDVYPVESRLPLADATTLASVLSTANPGEGKAYF